MEKLKIHSEKDSVDSDLVRFFYLSFRYSQGSSDLQEQIFNWTASSKLLAKPPTNIPEIALLNFKLPKRHTDLSTDVLSAVFTSEWRDLVKAFMFPVSEPNIYLPSIVTLMIEQDIRFVRIGRGTSLGKIKDDSDQDPNTSYIRRYVFLGKPSGHPVFNRLFLDLKKMLKPTKLGERQSLKSLEKLWEEKHPGQKFFKRTN